MPEGALLPRQAVGPLVRDRTIDCLADHRGDGHSPSARRAAETAHLLLGQRDLRADHAPMISPGPSVMYVERSATL